jgi:hypothetical protein
MEREEIIERLKHTNPYPENIFVPIQNKDMRKVVKLLKDNGFSPDALFGHWGREVWDNCIDRVVTELSENTCKSCGREMVNQVEPEYLCMNPKCDNYIKVQKPTELSEVRESVTDEEIKICKNCKKWHRFRLSDNGDCSLTKGVTKEDYSCAEWLRSRLQPAQQTKKEPKKKKLPTGILKNSDGKLVIDPRIIPNID